MNTLRYFTSSNPLSALDAKPTIFTGRNDSNNTNLIDTGMEATLSFPNDVIGSLACNLRTPPKFGLIPSWPDIRLQVVCENGELEFYNHIMPTIYHSITVSVRTGKDGKRRKTRVEKVHRPISLDQKGEDWWTTCGFYSRYRGRGL